MFLFISAPMSQSILVTLCFFVLQLEIKAQNKIVHAIAGVSDCGLITILGHFPKSKS